MEKELLIPHEKIVTRIHELAEQISYDYEGRDPVLIGVLNGVVFFFAELLLAISVPITMDFMKAVSYGAETTSSGTVHITKDIELDIKGKPVILIEDIVDTGLTLTQIMKHIEQKKPKSIAICSLIDKAERRTSNVPINYSGFQIESGFLVGYGLDFNEHYRNLSDIYTLRETD